MADSLHGSSESPEGGNPSGPASWVLPSSPSSDSEGGSGVRHSNCSAQPHDYDDHDNDDDNDDDHGNDDDGGD